MNAIHIKKIVIIGIIVLFFSSPLMESSRLGKNQSMILPDPACLEMSIDEIIQKRTSVRDFTDEPLSLSDLSTLLYHAYGIRADGSHTIPSFQGDYAVQIYVLTKDGIYQYEPNTHQLLLYSEDDVRSIGQYTAPVQLGICWDTTKNDDENIVGMQIGAVGQNIYHSCIAMNLGTVATAEVPSPLDTIGLPDHMSGRIVMPLGHPTMDTKYTYLPLYLSFLPKVKDSNNGFTSTIQEWNLSQPMNHSIVYKQQISQFIWACYGYSYHLDHSGFETHFIERHRTVPSAHGYYPLEIYVLNEAGMYWYIPGLRNNDPFGLPIVTFLWRKDTLDLRPAIAQITDGFVKDAPLTFVITLNIEDTIDWDDLSDPSLRWVWTYEAGACIQNVILDCVAWGFSNQIYPIEQPTMVKDILGLNDDFDPFVIISIG